MNGHQPPHTHTKKITLPILKGKSAQLLFQKTNHQSTDESFLKTAEACSPCSPVNCQVRPCHWEMHHGGCGPVMTTLAPFQDPKLESETEGRSLSTCVGATKRKYCWQILVRTESFPTLGEHRAARAESAWLLSSGRASSVTHSAGRLLFH